MKKKHRIAAILNGVIAVCVAIAFAIMVSRNSDSGMLHSSGITNLKYFTAQSNVILGAAAILCAVYEWRAAAKNAAIPLWVGIVKLAATASTTLTFLTVLCFFVPLYGADKMYNDANLYYHLIVPLLGLLVFLLGEGDERIEFRHTLFAAIEPLLYGTCYTVNVMVNGIGVYPDTNDWYGFVNWGYPVAFVIFSVIVLVAWLTAVILRLPATIMKKSKRVM